MKVGILGQRGGWHEQCLQKAFSSLGIKVPRFPITRVRAEQGKNSGGIYVDDTRLDDFDALVVRAVPGGSLEEIIFRMDALHALEDRGVWIVNSPRAIERTVNKYYTLSIAEAAGISIPRSIVTQNFDEAMAAFELLGKDMVIKPLFGAEGRGMVRVTDKDTAYRALRALELGRYIYYLQEFVPHGCQDIRCFVLNGEVIGAMTRKGKSWKTNVAQGATGKRLDPSETLCKISIKAAQLLGVDYAGVDLLPLNGGGYLLIEVNGIPAWGGLKAATGINAGQLLAEHMAARLSGIHKKDCTSTPSGPAGKKI